MASVLLLAALMAPIRTVAAPVERESVEIVKGPWRLTCAKGDVLEVKCRGTNIISLIGGMRIKELKEASSFADSALFLGEGTWKDEAYAMWEARMDDGEYYITQVGQVTHVGKSLTWTAHVTWLPPAFFNPAHMNVQIVLAPGALDTIGCGGKQTALSDLNSAGGKFRMDRTEFAEGFKAVLEGPAGKFELRTVGLERGAEVAGSGKGIRIALRENEEYLTEGLKGFVLHNRRAMGKWVQDIHVHRITLTLTPL